MKVRQDIAKEFMVKRQPEKQDLSACQKGKGGGGEEKDH